ncbi:MAG: deoxyribodipyrimidine photo-lyase [Bacteroidetes bacterium]|nr:deoxyribodipyrimidine photo-lyase [Bacteroidota bacterium]
MPSSDHTSSSGTTIIFWFRRDLRTSDNSGFAAATADATRVVPVFVFDRNFLDDLTDQHDRRVSFIHESVKELRARLRGHGSNLIVLHGDPLQAIPELAEAFDADAVYTNRDYEPYAKLRDDAVARALAKQGRNLRSFKDQVIFEGKEVEKADGEPYRVFTPYKKAWLRRIEEEEFYGSPPDMPHVADLSRLAPASHMQGYGDPWSLKDLGFKESELWLTPGEAAALERLADFIPRMARYKEERDFPQRNVTSGLSVHLRFGTISVRECVRAARAVRSEGAATWLSELIWREFYQMILDRYPFIVNHAFQQQYDRIAWPGSDAHFEAWCEGRTGYPIVDAAMRHFNATGWMHNRLRMIVAMFLTKDLLVDWRRGAEYFAAGLLDFELASNNGGWQWSASTGVDAAPYFRIFNPVLQSRKFDAEGAYIRTWVPELRAFDSRDIHWPADADMLAQREAGCILGEDYPFPIVDHAEQKERAIALFASQD